MRKSEREIAEIKKQNIFLFEKLLLEEKLSIEDISQQFSGIPHLNNLKTFAWDWVPEKIANNYEVDIDEVKNLSLESFAERYVHPITVKQVAPKYINALKNYSSRCIETFNYIRLDEKAEYGWTHNTWFFSFRLNKIVGIAHYLKNIDSDIYKEKKLLGEYDFIRKNFSKFMLLTLQQRKVLKLLALGYTNQMVSMKLNISPNTARLHRNNIHEALDLRWKNINHSQIYVQYALHFGLLQE